MQTVMLHWDSVRIDEKRATIDGAAIRAFTRGHCHSLALAIHDRTGWPLYGLGTCGGGCCPAHVVVYCPLVQDYLDIQGTRVSDRWRVMNNNSDAEYSDWGADYEYGVFREMSREDACSLNHYMTPNTELAKPFAKKLIKSVQAKARRQNSRTNVP